MVFDRRTCLGEPLVTLGTNGRGAMSRARVSWGELESRYDALLAANLHPDFPVDRQVMLARCRAWVVHQGTSQAVGTDSLVRLGFDYASRSCWEYRIPVGRGRHIVLAVALELVAGENLLRIHFHRHRAADAAGALEDAAAVRLILRPDIEDRSFHETTKAFAGPEREYPAAVSAGRQGFTFSPHAPRRLEVLCDSGEFVSEPEWQYMVRRPIEARRGLDPDSDLFSPGWFRISLTGGQTATLSANATAEADAGRQQPRPTPHWVPGWFDSHPPRLPLGEALAQALDQYVVRRGSFHTVIAGYPWFLDWGRDTLIVVRGLVAAGRLEQAAAILQQFAPLRGARDASEHDPRRRGARPRHLRRAALVLRGLPRPHGSAGRRRSSPPTAGARSLRDVLVSMAGSLAKGAANGVRMDGESGLLWSPAHFTWMDTNHPAGTPREGYPIEIQALWHAALSLLARIDAAGPAGAWDGLAAKVRESIERLYALPAGWLSDCLHARAGAPAAGAARDDALRPNQLFAVTLGAVGDPALQRGVLDACAQLLVPGRDPQPRRPPRRPAAGDPAQRRAARRPAPPLPRRLRGRRGHAAQARLPQRHGVDLALPLVRRGVGRRSTATSGRETALAWLGELHAPDGHRLRRPHPGDPRRRRAPPAARLRRAGVGRERAAARLAQARRALRALETAGRLAGSMTPQGARKGRYNLLTRGEHCSMDPPTSPFRWD